MSDSEFRTLVQVWHTIFDRADYLDAQKKAAGDSLATDPAASQNTPTEAEA